jgi:hypothetical protein
MQSRRTEVDGPLKNNNTVIVPANDTKGQWAASGQCVSGGKVVQGHSGSGPLAMQPLVDYDKLTEFSDAVYARLNTLEKRFHIGGTFGKSQMTVQAGDTSRQERAADLVPALRLLLRRQPQLAAGTSASTMRPTCRWTPAECRARPDQQAGALGQRHEPEVPVGRHAGLAPTQGHGRALSDRVTGAGSRGAPQCVRAPAGRFSPRARASSSTAIPSARMPAGICAAAIDDKRSRKNGHGYGGRAKNTSPASMSTP